jgi:hypothetical protein
MEALYERLDSLEKAIDECIVTNKMMEAYFKNYILDLNKDLEERLRNNYSTTLLNICFFLLLFRIIYIII